MKAILVGFMGSGKTTVGQLLAQRLGTTQRDLDAVIVDRAGKSIQQIFDDEGEASFRQMEHDTLADVLENTSGILSTGGGTPIQPANFDLLKASPVPVILLNVKPETIMDRLADDTDRPLVKELGLDGLVDLKGERDARYHGVSDVEIQTDELTPEEVVDAILASNVL
ncbi:shikimate kinase [Secundilactobacillus similis]|jgi:shikimate kinase|uniref:Shikimate kinase n=1 Tax=Secundilactobacillus similis DSM 23365 = JCM 2765 TaxID=1423804 RepID=A0A0R2FFS2_9LACO|nr:shikimate kinase [Secundilactobacillus similis]KRN26486.1 shikimate kinase [Secundilactobacillus similis DSM 23365 = JCM 2765]